MIINSVTVTLKTGVAFIGKKDLISYRYIDEKGKNQKVVLYSPSRYQLIVRGSKYKYFSDAAYSKAVDTAVNIAKYKWDSDFFCPEGKLNKIV